MQFLSSIAQFTKRLIGSTDVLMSCVLAETEEEEVVTASITSEKEERLSSAWGQMLKWETRTY
jgi:hypothetical protein